MGGYCGLLPPVLVPSVIPRRMHISDRHLATLAVAASEFSGQPSEPHRSAGLRLSASSTRATTTSTRLPSSNGSKTASTSSCIRQPSTSSTSPRATGSSPVLGRASHCSASPWVRWSLPTMPSPSLSQTYLWTPWATPLLWLSRHSSSQRSLLVLTSITLLYPLICWTHYRVEAKACTPALEKATEALPSSSTGSCLPASTAKWGAPSMSS